MSSPPLPSDSATASSSPSLKIHDPSDSQSLVVQTARATFPRTNKRIERAFRLVLTARARCTGSKPPLSLPLARKSRFGVQLSTDEYKALWRKIEQDASLLQWSRRRLHYSWAPCGDSGRLIIRMASLIHDAFATQLGLSISMLLMDLRKDPNLLPADAERLDDITPTGASGPTNEDGPVYKSDYTFSSDTTSQPVLVIEIAFSQDKKELERKVDEWFRLGANTVLVVDIGYSRPEKRKATSGDLPANYTLTRIKMQSNGRPAIKDEAENIDFLADPTGFLELFLSDFCVPASPPGVNHPLRVSHQNFIRASKKANIHQRHADQKTRVPPPPNFAPRFPQQLPAPTRASPRNKEPAAKAKKNETSEGVRRSTRLAQEERRKRQGGGAGV